MIKPIQIADSIIGIGQKAAKEINGTETISEAPAHLAEASGELLQAYHGVSTKKLFESFSEFTENFKSIC